MKILGVGTPYPHDPSAALYVDGKLIAAVEEERFTREKHAEFDTAARSVQFCLKQAGLEPNDIDVVAFPWSYEWHKKREWKSFRRLFFPYISRAFKSVLQTEKIRNLDPRIRHSPEKGRNQLKFWSRRFPTNSKRR